MIRQNGNALNYASEWLQSNFQFVIATVRQDSLSLQFASLELGNNNGVILTAVINERNVIICALERLKRKRGCNKSNNKL